MVKKFLKKIWKKELLYLELDIVLLNCINCFSALCANSLRDLKRKGLKKVAGKDWFGSKIEKFRVGFVIDGNCEKDCLKKKEVRL